MSEDSDRYPAPKPYCFSRATGKVQTAYAVLHLPCCVLERLALAILRNVRHQYVLLKIEPIRFFLADHHVNGDQRPNMRHLSCAEPRVRKPVPDTFF